MLPESLYFWEIQNSTIIQTRLPSKYFLCKCTILPTTVDLLETLLEAFLFQDFSALPSHFYDVNSIKKVPFFQCSFNSRVHIKIRWSQVRGVRGMLQYCHIVFSCEILDQNQPVCWSIIMKEKQFVPIFRGNCLLTASPRRQMMLMHISIFTFLESGLNLECTKTVNYTREFRELFETITYLRDRGIR